MTGRRHAHIYIYGHVSYCDYHLPRLKTTYIFLTLHRVLLIGLPIGQDRLFTYHHHIHQQHHTIDIYLLLPHFMSNLFQ